MIEQKEYYDRKKAEEMAPAKELYDAMSTVIKKQYPEQWKKLFPQWIPVNKELPKKAQWIPVNKELPKKDGEYLVTVGGDPDVDTAWFYYGHWIHQFGCSYEWNHLPVSNVTFTETVKVIAWMPLPEPYEEEEDNDRN